MTIPYLIPTSQVILIPGRDISWTIGYNGVQSPGEAVNQELVLGALFHCPLKQTVLRTNEEMKTEKDEMKTEKDEINLHVMATGTMVPLVMWCSISSPYYQNMKLYQILIKTSYTLKYQYLYLGSRGCPLCPQQISRRKVYMTIFLNYPVWQCYNTVLHSFVIHIRAGIKTNLAHWVPLPAPGPPSTNITLGFASPILKRRICQS